MAIKGKIDKQIQLDNKKAISNDDIIINDAIGLKSLSIATDAIVKKARKSIQKVKDEINNIDSNNDNITTSKKLVASEDNLRILQDISVNESNSFLTNIDINKDKRILKSIDELVKKSTSRSYVKKKDSGIILNDAIPDLDYIFLGFNNKKGSVDAFFSKIVFTLPKEKLDNGNIKAYRIFRAINNESRLSRRLGKLSINGINEIISNKNVYKPKNNNQIANYELRLKQSNIDNSITSLLKIDEFTKERISAIDKKEKVINKISNNSTDDNIDNEKELLLSSYIKTDNVKNIDISVIKDNKSLRNIQLQFPEIKVNVLINEKIVGKNFLNKDSASKISLKQIKDFRKAAKVRSNISINLANEALYKEIMFIPISNTFGASQINQRIIGRFVEFTVQDASIEFGKSYRYYITTVDDKLNESIRSRIVQLDVEMIKSPNKPKSVITTIDDKTVQFSILSNDNLVEKFEIYRKDLSSIKQVENDITTINGKSGFLLEKDKSKVLKNGFIQVGEALNSKFAGTIFISNIIPGKKYKYRIYSVDIFGNKSSQPIEVIVFAKENSIKTIDLKRPSILLELDSKTRKIKATLTADDDRIKFLFLARRNLTINEKGFTIPSQLDAIKLGKSSIKRFSIFDGKILRSNEHNWNGIIKNNTKKIEFIDNTVKIDNIYQYNVYGTDLFGNKSSYDVSNKLFVSRRPQIDKPVNFSASFVFNEDDGNFKNVNFSWDNGNLDVEPEDLMGNKEILNNTSINTIYQIERKEENNEVWLSFPMIDKLNFVDNVSNKVAPSYRPSFLELNKKYIYRIAAYQSGGFISNFSDNLEIITSPNILNPDNFIIKSCDSRCEPFFVVLNWDTNIRSANVDHWEIERATVNNFAALRINTRNINEFNRIKFSKFKKVFFESSRGREKVDDEIDKFKEMTFVKNNILVGKHHLVDDSVEFGNSYFYRIRAISAIGSLISNWVFRGVRVNNDSFERKLNSILTQDEKNSLVKEIIPLKLKDKSLDRVLNDSCFTKDGNSTR